MSISVVLNTITCLISYIKELIIANTNLLLMSFCITHYRILLEKRQAQDAMELLKLYHQSVANGTEDLSPPKQERVNETV